MPYRRSAFYLRQFNKPDAVWFAPLTRVGGAHRSSEQQADSDRFFLAGGRGPDLSAVRQSPGRDRK